MPKVMVESIKKHYTKKNYIPNEFKYININMPNYVYIYPVFFDYIMNKDLRLELAKVHEKIAGMLGLEMQFLKFNYSTKNDLTTLELATLNPRHQQTFLFHTTTGFGEMDALNKMEDYVKEHKNSKSSYTIQWAMTDNNELHTSYFTGKTIYEVLDKFYYGKAITGTIIFNISLNPLS